MPEGRVPPMRIVPAFDVAKDLQLRLAGRLETVFREQLRFERGEKALGHRAIIRIAARAHRGPDAEHLAAVPEGNRPVLTALSE